MNFPHVSIIILNWNGVEDTVELLESLKNITYPNYNIIVVDNGSSGDDVRIFREKYGDTIDVIANDKNYGYPEGNNIGMRYALGKGTDYLLLLNNDIVVDPQFLTELVTVAESDPSYGILGSKLYYYQHPTRLQCAGGKIVWSLGLIWPYGSDEEDHGQYDEIAERDFVWGISWLIKKEVVDKISFIDPYFFFNVEEYDYCTRAKRAGFKIIYVPKSKIWHKFGASRAKLPQFPETQKLIEKKRGWKDSKYYYRLFQTYCPPVLFIFPFLSRMLMIYLPIEMLRLLWQRDFRTLNQRATTRLKSLLKVSSKSHLPH